MKQLFSYLFSILILFIVSCQSDNTTQRTSTVYQVDLGTAKDSSLVNMQFTLADYTENDSLQSYILHAKVDQDSIGLQIDINSIVAQPIGDSTTISQDTLIANAVRMYTIGKQSDRLIHLLSQRFGINGEKSFSNEGAYASIFPLSKQLQMENTDGNHKLTLYFPEEEMVYAPMLSLTIDVTERTATLAEMDVTNRERLIAILSQ